MKMTYAWINHGSEDRNKQLFHEGRALGKVCWNLGSSKYSQNIWEREQTVKWQGRLMISWLTQRITDKNQSRRTAKRPQRTEYPGKHTAGYVWLSNQREYMGKAVSFIHGATACKLTTATTGRRHFWEHISTVFCSNQKKKLDVRNE